jgi:Cu-Zn family superoxide dismutase
MSKRYHLMKQHAGCGGKCQSGGDATTDMMTQFAQQMMPSITSSMSSYMTPAPVAVPMVAVPAVPRVPVQTVAVPVANTSQSSMAAWTPLLTQAAAIAVPLGISYMSQPSATPIGNTVQKVTGGAEPPPPANCSLPDDGTKAICFMGSNGMSQNIGYVTIEEQRDSTIITCHLKGLPPNSQLGFHVHDRGNIGGTDASHCCSHYNPFGKQHAGLNENGHIGDLGNITISSNGTCNQVIESASIKLLGPYSVLGRSFVIHAGTDDLGRGTYSDSKTSGHSGPRISCGVIGRM